VLNLTQDRCSICAERTIGSEIVLDAPDGTPRGRRFVESFFSLFGDSVSIGASKVHGLRQTYRRLRNHFERTRWNSYVTRLKWKLDLVGLEIVLILTQDRCTVCAERTIG
jgi:hypothetical protein